MRLLEQVILNVLRSFLRRSMKVGVGTRARLGITLATSAVKLHHIYAQRNKKGLSFAFLLYSFHFLRLLLLSSALSVVSFSHKNNLVTNNLCIYHIKLFYS